MNTQMPKWAWYMAGIVGIVILGLAGLYMFRLVFTPPGGGGGEFALVRHMMQMLESGYRNDAWSRFWATLLTGIGFLMAVSIPSIGIAVLLYRGREAFGKGAATSKGEMLNERAPFETRGMHNPDVPEEMYPPSRGFPPGEEDPRVMGGYRFPVAARPDFPEYGGDDDDPDIPRGVHDPEARFAQYLRDRNAA